MQVVIPILGLTRHGGVRVLMQIANEFVRSGHCCRIVTPKPVNASPFWLDPRVVVEAVGPHIEWKLLRWLVFALRMPALSRRGDCLVVSHFVTAVPARLMEWFRLAQVVYLVQDIEYRFYRAPARWLAQVLCRWTWHLKTTIPANDYLAGELIRLGAHVDSAVNLGVDPFFLQPAASSKAPAFDVVCMLRGERHKRSDRLLEIADRLRAANVSLLCICQDASLAAGYGERFSKVIRPTSDTELRDAYDDARLFLLTSDQEGFALPPLECMARGLPSILFPCGGADAYAVDDLNSVFISDESTETAAREIISLLEQPDRYSRLSRHAEKTAVRYDMSVAVREFCDRCLVATGREA